MMTYIFLYNVEYIKSDFSKLCFSENQRMVLLASNYCLSHLSPENKACFDAICEFSKGDCQKINYGEVEQIVSTSIKQYGSKNIRLLTNEDSTQIVCARLREKYGIPGFSVDEVLPFVNKTVAKQRLGNVVQVPKFVSFNKAQYLENKGAYLNLLTEKIGFPMVAQPVDFISGAEFCHITNINKLKNVAEKILQHDYEFEITECIDEDVFHCDILLIGKKMVFFVVGKYSSLPTKFLRGVPLGILQIDDENTVGIFKRSCEKIVEKLNCPSGAYHIKAFLQKKSGVFVFISIAARNGEHFILKMCDRQCGINIEETNYLIQMRLIDDVRFIAKKIFLGSITFPKTLGKVVKITRPTINVRNEFVEWVKIGDVVTQTQNFYDMSCGIIFWDESYQKVKEIFEGLKNYNPLKMFSPLPMLQQPDKVLELLFKAMPFVYWKDVYGRYQGGNLHRMSNFGFNSPEHIIGKTIFEILDDQEEARLIDENDSKVMEENIPQIIEEKITSLNGARIYYSQKSPVHDSDDNVIGLVGFSVDITELIGKEDEATKISRLLFAKMPFIFWKDINGIYLGANGNEAINLGLNSPQDMIGKTVFEFLSDQKAAALVDENDNRIMRENVTRIVEEKIDNKTYLSQKSPIHDDRGNVTGMLGFSMDITAIKQKEEGLINKINRVFQTVHDIRSPLASLLMIVESCKSIPESERVALKEAATGISDIANNLLSVYKKNLDVANNTDHEGKDVQHVLMSLALTEILSEKRYQYKNLPVKFNCSFETDSNFVFIRINPSNFNRMISNLINNAVDALEGKSGKVNLKLKLDGSCIKIIVQDNGKGMSQEIVDKIMNGVPITSGKKDGNGIGFSQVRNTLQSNKGKISIESKVGKGTKVTLTFTREGPPDWIAGEIKLQKGDTVVVLDDDSSIHGAWKTRFKFYSSEIKLYHFKSGEKAVKFINNFALKERIFLLSDFELIDQALNGLQIIKLLAMQQRAILVTNHHNNQKVRSLAAEARVKILPKQLASEVPVCLLFDNTSLNSKKSVIIREINV